MVIMWLCEQNVVYLRPHTNYRFVVKDSCPDCVRLAKIYGYEPNDINTWEGEGGT